MDIFYELEWNFQTLSSVSKCRVDEVKLKISLASGSVFNSNLALQKERVPHLLIGFVLWYRFNLAPRKAHFFQRKTRTRIPVFAISEGDRPMEEGSKAQGIKASSSPDPRF